MGHMLTQKSLVDTLRVLKNLKNIGTFLQLEPSVTETIKVKAQTGINRLAAAVPAAATGGATELSGRRKTQGKTRRAKEQQRVVVSLKIY